MLTFLALLGLAAGAVFIGSDDDDEVYGTGDNDEIDGADGDDFIQGHQGA